MRERVVWDADRLQAALNVVAGVAFSVGSLLFLDSALMRLGIYLFVAGSLAMAGGAIAVWRLRYTAPRTGHAAPLEPVHVVTPEAGPSERATPEAPCEAPLAASAATEVGETAFEERYLRAS